MNMVYLNPALFQEWPIILPDVATFSKFLRDFSLNQEYKIEYCRNFVFGQLPRFFYVPFWNN